MTVEALIVLVTALVVLATAVIGLLMKLDSRQAELHKDVQEVHVLVNSRMREALARITQLHSALVDAGIAVPDNGRET